MMFSRIPLNAADICQHYGGVAKEMIENVSTIVTNNLCLSVFQQTQLHLGYLPCITVFDDVHYFAAPCSVVHLLDQTTQHGKAVETTQRSGEVA
jgi:hypothetical protein